MSGNDLAGTQQNGALVSKVPIYIFSSESLEHVEQAHKLLEWAVREPANYTAMERKARQMPRGSHGVFYCADVSSEQHFLTMPFQVTDPPDFLRMRKHAWPGFVLPFKFQPLGSPSKRLYRHEIAEFFSGSVPDNYWNRVLLIAPTQAFVPSEVESNDWTRLLERLAEDSRGQ